MRTLLARVLRLLLFLVAFSAAGCAVFQFPVLKTSEGWVKLAQPPQEEKEILAAADQGLRAAYANSGFEITWFQNPDGEYLLYVRDKAEYEIFDEDGHCSDNTFRFKKSNGVWVQEQAMGLGNICID